MFLTLLMLLMAIIVVGFFLPLSLLWFLSVVGSGAPFVPVPQKAVPGIVKALELKKGSVVYDMGCGDGRILRMAKTAHPEIRAIGIEKALLPYLLAKFFTRNTDIEIRRNDFFKENLSDATHVVTYLFPTMMESIMEKLSRELPAGVRVIAVDFPAEGKEATAVIEQKVHGIKRGTTLYIYD